MVNDTIFIFLLIIVASFMFSVLLSRVPLLRIPWAVSYLLFGILLQTHLAQFFAAELWWIHNLGTIGLFILMFVSGLEVDVSVLHPRSWKLSGESPFVSALLIFTSTLLVSFLGAQMVRWTLFPTADPYMLTLLFSTTSLGIILPILEEAGLLRTEYGQTLLVSALLADFLTMLLVSLLVSQRGSGDWIDVMIGTAIIPVSLFVHKLLNWLRRVDFMRKLAGDAQARIRAVVALFAGCCAFSFVTGAEPILGSFVAGMLVAAIPFAMKTRIRDFSYGLGYGFFIPVFFISVGLSFNLRGFSVNVIWQLLVLITVAYAVKFVPALFLRRRFGKRKTVGAGFLLASRLSLVVAAAQIGVRVELLPQDLADLLVIVAVFTSLVSPIGFVSTLGHSHKDAEVL